MGAIILTVLISATVFLAVASVLALTAKAKAPVGRSLADLLAKSDAEPIDLDTRPDPIPTLSRVLSRTPLQRRIQLAIIRAGLLLRPSELLTITFSGAILGAAIGFVLRDSLGAALGLLALSLAPWVSIAVRQGNRKKALVAQLSDALDLICSGLRAGHGFSEALKTVSEQMSPPFAEEARRVVDELGLGLSLEQALDRMIVRTDQPDVELMCTAVQIQIRTGGNLAEVLQTIAQVIRERTRLRGEVAALTAEGRFTALILLVLPWGLALAMSQMSPGWLQPLFKDIMGNLILGAGIVAYVGGAYVLHKMLQIDL
jgi:tight adherence protein B